MEAACVDLVADSCIFIMPKHSSMALRGALCTVCLAMGVFVITYVLPMHVSVSLSVSASFLCCCCCYCVLICLSI